MCFRVDCGDVDNLFDYRDFNGLNTGLMIISGIGLLYCLDDAGLCMPYLGSRLNAIGDNPLSPLQLREMLAHLSYLRYTLAELPTFGIHFDENTASAVMRADLPARADLLDYDRSLYGDFLYLCLEQLIPHGDLNTPETIALIKSGDANFILDERGCFMRNGTPIRSGK